VSEPITTRAKREELDFGRPSDFVARAHELATEAHEGQRRKDDGSPYITHPVTVAGLLDDAGFSDEMIAAALLHDVVEDTDMDSETLQERFGERVAELVAALSEDKDISDYQDRKREHREQVEESGPDAVAIYIADKLSNLRDMRAIYALEGEDIAERFNAPIDVRIRLWKEDAEMAQRVAPELTFLPAFRAELAEFERQRASSRRSTA
jgi:(p)ppGpp synthase/HD superfamily hydrolase